MIRHPDTPFIARSVAWVAAIAFFPFIVVDLGAQASGRTPPTPPRPATAPRPAATPRPAMPPSPATAPRANESGWDDAISGRLARVLDADMIALSAERAAMAATREAARASVWAAEHAQAAIASSMDRLRDIDFAPLAALAPMAPMGAMQQPATAWNFDFDNSRDLYGRQGGLDRGRLSSRPPEPWQSEDPADSLYREARKALSSDSYRKAAELFRRIRDQYPKSVYTPDAPYWEAFALQRLGNDNDLRAAADALTWQQKQFPKAATRGDATSLATSIDGALARRGDREAYGALVGKVNQTTSQGCPRDNDDERVIALNALARMDSAQFLPVIKKALARRENCTQALRKNAVWLYARSKAADAPQVLMNVARTDPDREVREQAVFWMANVPTEEATTMLIELARSGSDLDLRKRAVYALSRSKSPRAGTTLRDIAADANAHVELRSDALQWYMSGPGRTSDDATRFLMEVYGKADQQDFRNRVLQIIASRKNDEAREFLVRTAQNDRESLDTRRQALQSITNAGGTAAQIAAIYDRASNDLEIRKQAVGVLANMRDGAGIEKLLDVARNEKNADLKKTAVSYLGRTKDPRAMALLQEIVNK